MIKIGSFWGYEGIEISQYTVRYLLHQKIFFRLGGGGGGLQLKVEHPSAVGVSLIPTYSVGAAAHRFNSSQSLHFLTMCREETLDRPISATLLCSPQCTPWFLVTSLPVCVNLGRSDQPKQEIKHTQHPFKFENTAQCIGFLIVSIKNMGRKRI